MHIVSANRDGWFRSRIEAFITEKYACHHGAAIRHFAPLLIAAIDSNQILCAAGLRFAESGFFSGAYLDAPVHEVLSAQTSQQVTRCSVFEVASLCSSSPLAALPFIREIATFGASAGLEWAIFAATARLRTLVERMGLEPIELAVADPRRIPDAASWGRYYEAKPSVLAVHRSRVETGFATSANVIGATDYGPLAGARPLDRDVRRSEMTP